MLFANFAESVAEGRGKAAADSLRAARVTTKAKLIVDEKQGTVTLTPAHQLTVGQIVLVEAGDVIPADGEIIEGVASVNEAAITGESAPVIRESGGDRSAVTGGTTVVSDWIKVRVTSGPGSSFLDRMIAMVEGADRRKTPNEIALAVLLAGLTIVFLIAVVTLLGLGQYAGVKLDPLVLGALFICLIPTTIGGLLSAVGIAGMDRLLKVNVLATSGRAVEAAGDVDTLLLDKTGTITYGDRQAVEVIARPGLASDAAMRAALMASLADQTPEGRSIITLARNNRIEAEAPEGRRHHPLQRHHPSVGTGVRRPDLAQGLGGRGAEAHRPKPRQSGAGDGSGGGPHRPIRRHAARRLRGRPVRRRHPPEGCGEAQCEGALRRPSPHGPQNRDDHRRQPRHRRRHRLRGRGGRLPRRSHAGGQAASDPRGAGQGAPGGHVRRRRQRRPALAQADVGVAMQTGTQAAREAGNMVDLDSDPTKLIEIVEVGKQLLITRGALTTFSIANDVAKYFAIIPALFMVALPALAAINIMRLHSPQSAILSAVIFNAIIIVLLIPLALRGVKYRPIGADKLLARNLLIYGLGGVVAPFVGIKLIDLAVSAIGLA